MFEFVARAVDGTLHHHLLATEIGRDTLIRLSVLARFIYCLPKYLAISRTFRHFPHKEMSISGVFVILGYLWFIASTTVYFFDGIRLCYPALALFRLWGLGNKKRNSFSCA